MSVSRSIVATCCTHTLPTKSQGKQYNKLSDGTSSFFSDLLVFQKIWVWLSWTASSQHYLQSRRQWRGRLSLVSENKSLVLHQIYSPSKWLTRSAKKNCVFNVLKKGGKRKKNNNNTRCKKYKQSNELCRFRELIDEKKNRRDKHKNRSQKEAARRRTNHKRWSIVTTYLTRWDRHFQVGFYCNWRINEE
jgi:hypothetical protein